MLVVLGGDDYLKNHWACTYFVETHTMLRSVVPLPASSLFLPEWPRLRASFGLAAALVTQTAHSVEDSDCSVHD